MDSNFRFRPTVPVSWAYNPAYAHVQNEHLWQTAWVYIMQHGREAARRRRRGIQAGRGDLREIPHFADLRDIGERPDGGLIVRIHLPPAASQERTVRLPAISARR
jgi:hypothetical protein